VGAFQYVDMNLKAQLSLCQVGGFIFFSFILSAEFFAVQLGNKFYRNGKTGPGLGGVLPKAWFKKTDRRYAWPL